MLRLSRREAIFGCLAGATGPWLLTGCTSRSSPVAATASAAALVVDAVDVPAGGTHHLTATTRTKSLTIGKGGSITVPSGKVLTITVDGVETGQALAKASDTAASLLAGSYTGEIVLTVADANPVSYGQLTFPFRQAVYVGADGVVAAKSVAAAASAGSVSNTEAKGLTVTSTGDVFNGVFVTGRSYSLTDAKITMTGNGRCDFVGYGTAVLGTGASTRLVIDNANITTKGVVRTAVIAGDGANVVVKNSTISVSDGTLGADYIPSVTMSLMESAPWMLGISGNARATNVVGKNTKATYVSSKVTAEKWGALSTDDDDQIGLTAINSDISISGSDGYGSYCNGTATLRFLGTRFAVPSYGIIATGGSITLEDSATSQVKALNADLRLGLSTAELSALTPRATTIDSGRFGVMWHGAGAVTMTGGTRITTKEAAFLSKGQQVTITVDGSGGASLNPANGTIVQVMTNDDPGPVQQNGIQANVGVYTEPTAVPTKSTTFNTQAAASGDVVATFTKITLKGNFYNAFRGGPSPASASGAAGGGAAPGGAVPGGAAPGGAAPGGGAPGGGAPGGSQEGKNLVLTFDGCTISGVMSATMAKHRVARISAENYQEIGRITNTCHPVINNGVLVTLKNGSTWHATGTSYLSKLTVDQGSKVVAAAGRLTVTVNGTAHNLTPGSTVTGAIVVTAG
jgi:hypothetical protein